MSKNNAQEASLKSEEIIYIENKKKETVQNSQRRVLAEGTSEQNTKNDKRTLLSQSKFQGCSRIIKLKEDGPTRNLDTSSLTSGSENSHSLTGCGVGKKIASLQPSTLQKIRGKTTTIKKCNAVLNHLVLEKASLVRVVTPELLNFPRSLQITAVVSEKSNSSRSSSFKPVQNSTSQCVKCSRRGIALSKCVCRTALATNFQKKNYTKELSNPLITKTVIAKEKFYNRNSQSNILQQQLLNTSSSSVITRKMLTMGEQRGNMRGRSRGTRNRSAEPVCLTISDDDNENEEEEEEAEDEEEEEEEYMDTTPAPETNTNTSILHEPSSTSQLHVNFAKTGNYVSGPTDDNEDVEDEETIDEEEEADAASEKDDTSFVSNNSMLESSDDPQGAHISCRSIRIGSFKIHPVDETPFVLVFVNPTGFAFHVPTVDNVGDNVVIKVASLDILDILGHFGRCLPVMYLRTSIACGERIRKQLHMEPGSSPYFDPTQTDDKQKFITFLIDHLEESVLQYLRTVFPGDRILKEIDQKTANEILVKSTPTKANLQIAGQQVVQQTLAVASPVFRFGPHITCQVQPVIRREAHTPIKLLTYPPPPQTGGIAITSEDLFCLDEGEFLNDVIIDFYLKYLMHERFSESDRERTHIFSSFFYPRLTQKPNNRNVKPAEGAKTIKVKRHSHVKTWTKNIDIFEKDFIIIPINQSNHWFLAIICFPAMVADMPKPIATKPPEPVTSSNESEPSKNSTPPSPPPPVIKTKDQACSTEDQTNAENPSDNFSNEEDSDGSEDTSPDMPDSSTHPDKNVYYKHLPCILIFDSLSGPNRNRIMSTLREYLEMEWNSKKGTLCEFNKLTMRGDIMKVPQQTNFSDCGIYLLQYVESFFESPLPYFGTPMPVLHDWFPVEKVANKRKSIITLINELEKRYSNLVQTNSTKKSPKKVTDKLNDSMVKQNASSLPS